jgi:intracellular sulfur oxidation DsrE/DsrF family protein
MARRVVSLIRSAPGAVRPVEPSLEANAYGVAEDVDLVVVLRGNGVELAVAEGEVRPGELAGTALPPAASAQDLRGLVESGIGVYAAVEDLQRLGLSSGDLVDGVRAVDDDTLAELLRRADAVLTW